MTEKPIELAAVEDRHDEADVGLVGGAVVRVVVDDDVARAASSSPSSAKRRVDPADVAGDRPGLQRRGLRRLAELAALGVAERAAEVLATRG